MKKRKSWLFWTIPIFFLCYGVVESAPPKKQWHTSVYEIEIRYHYTSQCNPGTCEGEKILTLQANVRNVIFGHSPSPSFPCWFHSRSGGITVPHFGHGEGVAEIVAVEMCPHLSGGGVEPNKIVSRNNNFDINLTILSNEMAEEYQREKYGEDKLVPTPLVEVVWMQFQAMTPFANPAYEWENSDGNGLVHTFNVFFNVALFKLKKNQDIKINVPEADECGKGEWSIWLRPKLKNNLGDFLY